MHRNCSHDHACTFILDNIILNCRRLVKRIYVPLPDEVARAGLIQHLMRKQGSGGGVIVEDIEKLNAVVKMTAGYSGSDLSAVCAGYFCHFWPFNAIIGLNNNFLPTQINRSFDDVICILLSVEEKIHADIYPINKPFSQTTPYHKQVCHEAAMGPIRELGPAALLSVKAEDVRALEEKVWNWLSLPSFSNFVLCSAASHCKQSLNLRCIFAIQGRNMTSLS